MKKKVVIIGAGPAGLTAANELLKDDRYDVTILDECSQVGGIAKTINYKGNRMDIGGHRFFSKDDRILNYWKEILPLQGFPSYDELKSNSTKEYNEGMADPEREDNVLLLRRRVSRILYNGKFFDYPISLKFDTFKNLGIITTLKAGGSYLYSTLFNRKETNLEDFYINRFGKVLYECFFKDYTEKVWGRAPSEIAADWGKQRVKGVSIKELVKNALKLNRTTETSLIEEFWYPKYGPGQMWEYLEGNIKQKGCLVIKEFKVNKINIENEKVKSIIGVKNGVEQEIKADIFISSMPIKDLINSFSDKVPENINTIANNLPYRDFITVGILAKKIELKNNTKINTLNDIIPDCWIYVQEKNVKVGRIQIFNNWSPYLIKDVDNTIFIGLEYFVEENDELWTMSEEDFTEYAIKEIQSIGIIKKENILDSHVEKMRKAYPAYFDSYSYIQEVKEYLNKIENLYCIGRNGQHKYNNMDHSMLTAIECVNNIRENKKDKSNIWRINTEKEYHETK